MGLGGQFAQCDQIGRGLTGSDLHTVLQQHPARRDVRALRNAQAIVARTRSTAKSGVVTAGTAGATACCHAARAVWVTCAGSAQLHQQEGHGVVR